MTCGRMGGATPVCGRSPTQVIAHSTVAHPEDCTERIASWRTGRTGAGQRRSLGWPSRAVQAIGSPRADFRDGPEPIRLHGRGRRYDCSPTLPQPSGLTISHGTPRASRPCAAYGGALRAALTRAHAVASVQLCDQGNLRRTQREDFFERFTFLLTGGSPDTVLGFMRTTR